MLEVTKNATEHLDFRSVLQTKPQHSRLVLSCDVLDDCRALSEFEVTVFKIGQVREVIAHGVLDLHPAGPIKIWRVTALIHDILKFNFKILQQISDGLGETTDLPVAEFGLWWLDLVDVSVAMLMHDLVTMFVMGVIVVVIFMVFGV